MARILALVYGVAAYFLCLGTLLYAIGFVTGFMVPKTVDTGWTGPTGEAIFINMLLLSLFALQHSVMARKPFKRWWAQFIPASIERSTYVLIASLVLILLFWQWWAMPAIVWQVLNPTMKMALLGLTSLGWITVFISTFLINHFELFGLQQVLLNLVGQRAAEPRFRTPLLYKIHSASALSWVPHCFLGYTRDDSGPSALRRGHKCLHLCRYRPRRTRSDRSLW